MPFPVRSCISQSSLNFKLIHNFPTSHNATVQSNLNKTRNAQLVLNLQLDAPINLSETRSTALNCNIPSLQGSAPIDNSRKSLSPRHVSLEAPRAKL
jgi:hypothetical protein